ncbi:zinc finger protein 827, partial [Austrofundulus limnaeus]|uniref:Zinc finger protein 827 n=1 Tax=Austrofundulus limnaeus TaxID=52670 RepID=A0A2I4D4R2_AUSLI
MKRGSSVLQPSSDAAKRHTHTKTHTGDEARVLSVSAEGTADTHAASSSPFQAATSLFSPDVSSKMASDLLIRLSEATQKARVHPGSREEAEQQDEPGVALSPDGPGASPEPPSLTHTPDGNTATDTLASDLLRKLAERQEVNGHVLRLKEEEEPVEVNLVTHNQPPSEEISHPALRMTSHHLFTVKTEDQNLTGNTTGAKVVDECLLGLQTVCHPASKTTANRANNPQFRVKLEDHDISELSHHLFTGAKMEDSHPIKAKTAELPFPDVNINKFFSEVKKEDLVVENGFMSGAKMAAQVFTGVKMEEQLFFGANMEEQCLRAVLWQDMSVNLASTLLHQLSERVSKSNSQQMERKTPPIRSSPVLKVNMDQLHSCPLLTPREPPYETQTSLSRDKTTSSSYFFRCHVCGFETEGHALFQSHMMEHRQWEHSLFSLHCCRCEHSTNQEAEMRLHVETHLQGGPGATRCPVTLPAASSRALPVAVATAPEQSTSEHRCRICQRSFPGQQELLVHFQGHRQGNQYRCDRCGHLTRTANKLVEHVRVHTGERPFTCALCP